MPTHPAAGLVLAGGSTEDLCGLLLLESALLWVACSHDNNHKDGPTFTTIYTHSPYNVHGATELDDLKLDIIHRSDP